jgi:hypothetical protein
LTYIGQWEAKWEGEKRNKNREEVLMQMYKRKKRFDKLKITNSSNEGLLRLRCVVGS